MSATHFLKVGLGLLQTCFNKKVWDLNFVPINVSKSCSFKNLCSLIRRKFYNIKAFSA